MFFCSAFQVDVIVELRPMEDDVLLYRNVVLLLKCAKSVNWVIKTNNVGGKLVIVVRLQQKRHHTAAVKKSFCHIRMCDATHALLLEKAGITF